MALKLQILKPSVATLKPSLVQQAQPIEVQRLRGRAAVERRAEYLECHPLCAECEAEDVVTTATVPDHKIPLWAGGPDDLEKNGNPLCAAHHKAKTACEERMRAAAGWMSTSCVCGQHRG